MGRRLSRGVFAVTAVVVVAIAGGVTYAVAEIGGGGVINGCFKSASHRDDDDDGHSGGKGQLRVIDPATRQLSPERNADLVEPHRAARSAG
jgi:hypothetical protein